MITVDAIIIVLFLPFLLKNKKTFPFIFVLLSTNFLEFWYGLNSWIILNVGSGNTGNVFLSYYYGVVIIILIIRELKINPSYRIVYKYLFHIILILLFIGIVVGIVEGFQIQSFARFMRSFIRYVDFIYLGMYLNKSFDNVKYFSRVLFSFLLMSFGFQIIEMIIQRRIILPFIPVNMNTEGNYFFQNSYITISNFGEVFYSWNRFNNLIPLCIFLSMYYYFKKINLYFIKNKYIYIICLLSLVMALGRSTIGLALMYLLLISVFNLLNRKEGVVNVIPIIIIVSLIFFVILQYQSDFITLIVDRLLTVENLSYGEDTAAPRILVYSYQMKIWEDYFYFGRGFSFADTFSIMNSDLGITNLLPAMGIVGLTLPLYIIAVSYRAVFFIKKYDKEFYVVFAACFTVIVFYGFIQDLILENPLMYLSLMALIVAKSNNLNWPFNKEEVINE